VGAYYSILTIKYKKVGFKLSQSGASNPQTTTSGVLEFGKTYAIINPQSGDDFTLSGAPNNNVGTSFISNGTTPIWANGSDWKKAISENL